MIQSYLFDPVQVPSPGYVNEVNSCKLDEEDTVKLKRKQSSEVLVHKNDLWGDGLKRAASRSRAGGPQQPCQPHQGPLPQGGTGGDHCVEKTSGAVNGLGPAAALPPAGDPGSHQDDRGFWASTTNSVHPTQPFLDGGDAREQDCVPPASEETQVLRNGDSRAPTKAERPALEAQDPVLQIPAPDYPQLWGSAGDSVDHEEKDCLFQSHAEELPLKGIHPRAGEHGLNVSLSMKRSWDSLNEAGAAEVLGVYFKEESPAQAMAVLDLRNRWEDVHSSTTDRGGEMAEEDAAVAEALAALEAATAGEDVDETD